MIEIYEYSSLSEKNDFIADINLNEFTLIVSDLASKMNLIHFFLNKEGKLNGHQILRAEDFWRLLVHRLEPEINFVSQSALFSILKDFLNTNEVNEFSITGAKPQTLLKIINELLPIICHPDSKEIMENWFQLEPEKPCSWKPWYYLCEKLWNQLQNEKLLLSQWAAPYLMSQYSFENYWDRNLIIDLGAEIRTVEIDLLQTLSNKMKIIILSPNPTFISDFPWVSYPYEHLKTKSHLIKKTTLNDNKTRASDIKSNSDNFLRFSAPLAEVKFSISKIREWKENGVDFSKMSIMAPEIETYWPMLRWHLVKEGVPFLKSQTIRIGSQGLCISWISFLKKIFSHKLTPNELELANFYPFNFENSSFTSHQSQWSKKNSVPNEVHKISNEILDAQTFLNLSLKIWTNAKDFSSDFMNSLKKWALEAIHLNPKRPHEWLEYLESFLNQEELEIEPGDIDGIYLSSLLSHLPQERTNQIFLGCSEAQLKLPSHFISGSEILSLKYHTGHLLSHPDRDFREYQINLFFGMGVEQFYTFSTSDFSGADLSPSLFWLNGRERDAISLTELHSWTPSYWENELLTSNPLQISKVANDFPIHWEASLSPGSLETFTKCPFRFFAEKGLKLKDPTIVDLDLDARIQGIILHRLLELLTEEPFEVQEKALQLPSLIENILTEHSSHFYSPNVLELYSEQLSDFGNKFLLHESRYRKDFPNFKTVAREAWFKNENNVNGKRIPFKGKIDRVDLSSNGNEAIVIDYKSDIARYHNAPTWIQNTEFQLLSYASAVEGGFVQLNKDKMLPPIKVVAAHYFGMKDFKRKGFTINSISPGVVEIPTTKSTVSMEEKESWINEFNSILKQTSSKILMGEFEPIPKDKTECIRCPWRKLCRAPHLNL